ncbi:conserved hypothetical protein [Brochothrix thermosphacta]|nr:conserved hypothetical protein [Brochothrix thermosphacta]
MKIGRFENENNLFGIEDSVEKSIRLSKPDAFFEIVKNIGWYSSRKNIR